VELGGARVLVTGGSRGIGAALGRSFAAAGADVVLLGRSRQTVRAVADEIGGHAVEADLAIEDEVRGLIGRIEAEVGPLDVVVHNAGDVSVEAFHSSDEERGARQVAVNLIAPIRLSRQVLPRMVDRGRGHLVFVSSLQGVLPTPGCAVYGATKSALTHFASILELELRGTRVGITVVEPGPVATDMWDDLESSHYLEPVLHRFRRLQMVTMDRPEDLATTVVAAVAGGHGHVRTPRRAAVLYWLEAAPRAIARQLLRGIDTSDGLAAAAASDGGRPS
jgi:uncharacterized protein